jgi:hypothetical protein
LPSGNTSSNSRSVPSLGLGAEYDLSTKELTFLLSGLGIDFQRRPLQIGGAFLRFGNDFAGEVLLKTGALSLGAIGAYGEFQGQPSLFIDAFVDYPLGGPALLLFHQDEAPKVELKTVPLSDLSAASDSPHWPAPALESGQHAGDQCQVIEVPGPMLKPLLPQSEDELKLRTYARCRLQYLGQDADKGVAELGDLAAASFGNCVPSRPRRRRRPTPTGCTKTLHTRCKTSPLRSIWNWPGNWPRSTACKWPMTAARK